MKSRCALLALLVGAAPLLLRAEEAPPPEPIGATVREETDHTLYEAIVQGDLVDWTPLSDPGREPILALLLEMDDESRQVVLWRLAEGSDLQRRGANAPPVAESVFAFAADATSEYEVLVGGSGTLFGLAADGSWRARFASIHDLHRVPERSGERDLQRGELILRSVGRLQALAVDGAAGLLREAWHLELPLEVDRDWGGLRLWTPAVALLDRQSGGGGRWVLGPQAQGRRRLRTLLLESTEPGAPQVTEAWNLLPHAEEIEESWYVLFNGRPSLIVTSVLAEKHGVFEKKKLRLFELTSDRTKGGSGALLEVMTRSRNWYETCAGIADVNGDGLDDLVSAQPKGLGAGSLWVEAHLGLAGGGFESRTWGSEIEVEEGEECSLATDLDGDGRVELMVVEDDSLLVFRLSRQPSVKGVVDDAPHWRLRFHDLDGGPEPVRLFSPDRVQILLSGHTEGRRQAVRVLDFH